MHCHTLPGRSGYPSNRAVWLPRAQRFVFGFVGARAGRWFGIPGALGKPSGGLAAVRHSMCQTPSGRKAWKTKAKVTS